MPVSDTLQALYSALYECFGHRGWWPGRTPFEVMVGALLTQNTNWRNVERAIAALDQAGLLEPAPLAAADEGELQQLIRPAGYYRQKAARLLRLAAWVVERGGGEVSGFAGVPTDHLRAELLALRGIGPETADSILLYALDRPTFVVDAYTTRVVVRHGLLDPGCTYEELKELFEANLPRDLALYRDYHAQLVEVGKRYCRPRPLCEGCPVWPVLGQPIPDEELT